jgi:hypothetical protein
MKKLSLIILCTGLMAHAETSTTTADLSAPAAATADSAAPAAAATNTSTAAQSETSTSQAILKHVIAGWKSQNNSGRSDDLKNPNGRRTEAMQEVWAGYKNKGWGVYGLYASTYYNNAGKGSPVGKSNGYWSMNDPSVTLVHPNWYTGDDLVVTGKLRRYIPLSTYSDQHGMVQTAYYIDAYYKMAQRQDIFNNVTFRSFTYDNHGPSSTKNYVELTTNYTKYFSRDFRWGFGHWTQIEQHYGTPTGYSVELTPILDYAPTPKIFMGPRIRMPVVAQGAVYDGPQSASLNQAYFQFFLLANL